MGAIAQGGRCVGGDSRWDIGRDGGVGAAVGGFFETEGSGGGRDVSGEGDGVAGG